MKIIKNKRKEQPVFKYKKDIIYYLIKQHQKLK
jgi:hypothetical protein